MMVDGRLSQGGSLLGSGFECGYDLRFFKFWFRLCVLTRSVSWIDY